LPIALNNATKVVGTLLKSGKEYIALMYIHKKINENEIKKTLNEFIGEITQLPPKKSSVKRQHRQRNIYYLKIIEIEDQYVLFKVGCQAGTYIRKLIHDFGLKLGTKAHMVQLIRTKAGPFTDKNWSSLHDLKDAYEYYKEGNEKELKKIILPLEEITSFLPKIWISDTTVDSICHGADLAIPGISKIESGILKDDLIAILTLKGELVCLATASKTSEEIIEKDKGLASKTKRVIMKENTYPKFLKK